MQIGVKCLSVYCVQSTLAIEIPKVVTNIDYNNVLERYRPTRLMLEYELTLQRQVQEKPLVDPSGTHVPPFKHGAGVGSKLQADS